MLCYVMYFFRRNKICCCMLYVLFLILVCVDDNEIDYNNIVRDVEDILLYIQNIK